MLVILLCLLAVTPAALPKTRARSDVFTQLFRSIRKVPLHAASVQWYFSDGTKKHGDPPIKWQGSAWVLYNTT